MSIMSIVVSIVTMYFATCSAFKFLSSGKVHQSSFSLKMISLNDMKNIPGEFDPFSDDYPTLDKNRLGINISYLLIKSLFMVSIYQVNH